MTNLQIDQIFNGSPCLCGERATWHPECYRGKTTEQVATERRKVYRTLRNVLKRMRMDDVHKLMMRCRSSTTTERK